MGGLAADTELSGCRVDELVLIPLRASTESLGYVWPPGTSSTSSMGGLAADTELSGCRVDELVLIPLRASTESLGYVWPPGTSSTSSMGGLAADTELSGCRVDELVLLPPRASTESLGYVWPPGTSSTSSMGGLAADTELSGCRADPLVLLPPGPLKLRLDLDQCPLRPQGAESPADIEHRELPCNWSVPQAACLPSRQRCGRVPMLSTRVFVTIPTPVTSPV